VRNLSLQQCNCKEILQISGAKAYLQKENLLFLKGQQVPSKSVKSGLLWTDPERALPVTIPDFNFNYFGVDEKVEVNLVKDESVQQEVALVCSLENVEKYILKASKQRLSPLKWTIINDKALIIGSPLLPIPGKTYWGSSDFLIPSGLNLEFPMLHAELKKHLIRDQKDIVLWHPDGAYNLIGKEVFVPLSISSFRQTVA